MAWVRVFSSCAAVVAIAGCAAVAVDMSRAAPTSDVTASGTLPPVPEQTDGQAATWTPRAVPSAPHAVPSAASAPTATAAAKPSASPAATPRRVAVAPPAAARVPARAATTHASSPRIAPRTTAPRRASTPAARPAPTHTVQAAPVRGISLPVAGSTAGASRVLTVAAPSYGSTTATLQAWTLAPGGGWRKYGPAILAHVGADGVSSAPSESRSATPVGSFTLTQAFGAYSNPGTALPYVTTSASDWWISQSGPLYNTRQRCASSCGFTRGEPNEHLAYLLPYYRYSVVIDYNTRNAPGGVRQGAGSAFFLHVTDGRATEGCIAIPQSNLVSIMKWLTPAAHPRILIGVA